MLKSIAPSAAAILALVGACNQQKAQAGAPSKDEKKAPAPPATPPPPPDDAVLATASRLAGEIAVSGSAPAYLQQLSDRFGPRLTGSAVYEGAAAWAQAELRTAGLSNVHGETFTIPNGWVRGPATVRLRGPVERTLHADASPWSPPTPAGGVHGPVVILEGLEPEKIAAVEPKLKGAIVMFAPHDGPFRRNGFNWVKFRENRIKAAEVFAKAGVLAVLTPGRDKNEVLSAGGGGDHGAAGKTPRANLGFEDAKLVQRLAEAGPIELEVSIDSKIAGPTPVTNVVADLPGREHPDEWILVSAHLDAWDLGSGSEDNGAGIAMAMATARALAALPQPPRRSVRIVLWGGEEQGLLGSRAYVTSHSAELDKIVAVVNTDNGPGPAHGWHTEGRADVKAALEPLAKKLLSGLGSEIDDELTCDTDHASFLVWGVPVLNQWVDMEAYEEVHHMPSDTFDKIIPAQLSADAAIVAITAYALAEQPTRLAPRIDKAATEKMMGEQKFCFDEMRKPPTANP